MAGIPAADVLRLATLVSAKVMGEDKDFGSITTGKVADLVIINGKPHERVRDARNVELVMRGGKAYAPRALTDGMMTSVAPDKPQ
jgi:imidazolonepropionase-like amidohydrolase